MRIGLFLLLWFFLAPGLFLPVFAHPSASAETAALPPGRVASDSAASTITIGVLAYRGEQHARLMWKPTIDYLNTALTKNRFRMQPLSLPQMRRAIETGSLAFIITNPGNYVELEADFGVSRIVTLEPGSSLGPESGIGSAIVVRRDRLDLKTLADLRGKSLMAVSEHAFGGFQVAWRELKLQGIDPFTDLDRLLFNGFPQDDIAYAVFNGQVDAGVLRACLLEGMAQEGKIKLEAFRVLNRQYHDGFSCQASTRLYPNWPLAKLRSTSNTLAKNVAKALLAMPAQSGTDPINGYRGWTIPMDYQPVHELFRELQIGPYRWMRETTWQQLWDRYWQWIVIFVFALLWGLWHMARVEHLVTLRTQQLSDANRKLKIEMDERKRAEEQAHLHQAELAHVSRVSAVGELASGMAHELNQPLSAINSYAQGCALRLESGEIGPQELIDVHQHIVTQAERAGTIIQRFRGFLRKQGVSCTDVDLNKAVEEALELFSSEARKRDIRIELALAKRLPPVCAEMIQVEQVILNLMRNAAEAMQETEPYERILEITTFVAEDETVVIEIRDHGPGMSEETARHIFDPFFTTRPDGLGLGLSISRSIIESHGGRIELVRHDAQGVTLRISLPVYKGEAPDE